MEVIFTLVATVFYIVGWIVVLSGFGWCTTSHRISSTICDARVAAGVRVFSFIVFAQWTGLEHHKELCTSPLREIPIPIPSHKNPTYITINVINFMNCIVHHKITERFFLGVWHFQLDCLWLGHLPHLPGVQQHTTRAPVTVKRKEWEILSRSLLWPQVDVARPVIMYNCARYDNFLDHTHSVKPSWHFAYNCESWWLHLKLTIRSDP